MDFSTDWLTYLQYLLTNASDKYKCKEKFAILQSIGIIAIKVLKQGQSFTPTDIYSSGQFNP